MINRLTILLVSILGLSSCHKQVIEEVNIRTKPIPKVIDTTPKVIEPYFVYRNHFDSTYDDQENWIFTPRPNYNTCWTNMTLYVPKNRPTSTRPGIHLLVYFYPPCSTRHIVLPVTRKFDPELAKPNFSKTTVSIFGLEIDKTESGTVSFVIQKDSAELILVLTRSPAHHNSPLVISWEPRNKENPVSVTFDGVVYHDVVATINKVGSSTLNLQFKSELKIESKESEFHKSNIYFSGIEMNLWE
ncbi:MAG: hypothetical protein KDC83_13875 [Flavobacteriales bacterium]|nr:hypothetical protein [Flavobacteriales bacterium]